jgi:hypothetical protein
MSVIYPVLLMILISQLYEYAACQIKDINYELAKYHEIAEYTELISYFYKQEFADFL